MSKNKTLFLALIVLGSLLSAHRTHAQQSVARRWNDLQLQSIREDFARPPVQARNLFHVSLAMYEAWAAYDTVAKQAFLGKTTGTFFCPYDGIPPSANVAEDRQKAICYAAYRVLIQRYQGSPQGFAAVMRFNSFMAELGYSTGIISTSYQSGDPAALGNYIASRIIQYGLADGSNQLGNYAPLNYAPANAPLFMSLPGNQTMQDPNRWQPLSLTTAVDQNGNPIPATQTFQMPEWARTVPFAMTNADCDTFSRNDYDYYIYHNPGAPPTLDTTIGGDPSLAYKWNHQLVSIWNSHHNPYDGVMWDISPASIGNLQAPYPHTLDEYKAFYNIDGNIADLGHAINPATGQPYAPQMVPRGDYTRVLAQFWADGPSSETPPGHWFSIMNTQVSDHPSFIPRFNGKGPVMDKLEWDIKAYLTLGGAVHDAAIAAWGLKGWYDSTRPVAALRYMADRGQSSDPNLPNYDPAGLELVPGYIELVQSGDPLAGDNNENVNKIKLYTFRGPNSIFFPAFEVAGVDWILAENFWPYQAKTFVTPPFAGYISGHSTYSRAAAEVLTSITGDAFFPGGMGQFPIAANSGFLRLEQGPSVDVTLQWATYRDASDQTSLSRIWGSIHPPVDDIPGRIVGAKCGLGSYNLAKSLFYNDLDNDGFFSFEDCNDQDASIYPDAPELCDSKDNDCDGLTDENLPTNTYYLDADGDGFGTPDTALDTCSLDVPAGWAFNAFDCDDADAAIGPNAIEVCDGIDNNCNGTADEGLTFATYYADADGDGYGNPASTPVVSCTGVAPTGMVGNGLDCNDTNPDIGPNAVEVCDGVDNNCDGTVDEFLTFISFYADADGDGFGDPNSTALVTCDTLTPVGMVSNQLDCNDTNAAINPLALEVLDGLDNDCNGLVDDVSGVNDVAQIRLVASPNPVREGLQVTWATASADRWSLLRPDGQVVQTGRLSEDQRNLRIEFSALPQGVYLLRIEHTRDAQFGLLRVVKL
jgi:hypothetical protein